MKISIQIKKRLRIGAAFSLLTVIPRPKAEGSFDLKCKRLLDQIGLLLCVHLAETGGR